MRQSKGSAHTVRQILSLCHVALGGWGGISLQFLKGSAFDDSMNIFHYYSLHEHSGCLGVETP